MAQRLRVFISSPGDLRDDFLPPTPLAEKASTCKDQAGPLHKSEVSARGRYTQRAVIRVRKGD